MNRLIKDSTIYIIGGASTKALSVILLPLYTRYLSVEEYGILSLLNTVIQLLSFIFLMGLSSAAMRFYFDSPCLLHKRSVYGIALILLMKRILVLGFLVFLLFYYSSAYLLPSIYFYPYLVLAILISIFQPFIKLLAGFFRVRERAFSYVVFQLFFFLFQVGIIILAVSYFNLGVLGQLLAQLLVNMIFGVFAVIVIYRFVLFSFDQKISRDMMSFGLYLIPNFILVWGLNSIPRFFLEHFSGLKAVGLFAVAAQFAGVVVIFTNAFDNAMLPQYYKIASQSNASLNLGEFALKYLLVVSFVAFVVLLFSPLGMKFLVAPNYISGVSLVPYLIVYVWVKSLKKIFLWALMYVKKSNILLKIGLVSIFVQIILLFGLAYYCSVDVRSLIGVLIVAEVISVLTSYFFSQKYLIIHFPCTKISLIVVAFITLIVTLSFIRSSFDVSIYLDLTFSVVVLFLFSFFVYRSLLSTVRSRH